MAGLLGGVLPWAFSQGDRAKRYLGGLLSDPLGTAEQLGGLLQDNRREMNALDAATFGNPQSPFQVTNQNALGQLIDKTMAGPMGFAPVGMSQLIKPLGTSPHYAVNDLSEYTPKLYRETSVDRATEFMPNSMSSPQTLWFSNDPAYALGQGPNRGVMMEFNAHGVPGQLSLKKPMARQQYESGNAEFVSQDLRPEQIGSNLQSVRVSPDQQSGPYFRRVRGMLGDWSMTKEPDGTLVFTKPGGKQ